MVRASNLEFGGHEFDSCLRHENFSQLSGAWFLLLPSKKSSDTSKGEALFLFQVCMLPSIFYLK